MKKSRYLFCAAGLACVVGLGVLVLRDEKVESYRFQEALGLEEPELPSIQVNGVADPHASMAGDTLLSSASARGENYSEQYNDLNDNDDYPSLEVRLIEMQSRRGGRSYEAKAVVAQMSSASAWHTVERPGEELMLTEDELHDGREFIRFESMKIETLVPGDKLLIPIAQNNGEYTMQVTDVEVHNDGNVTWRGHLLDFDRHNQVSITRGDSLTVGGITTPHGHYTLQVRGDQGWIVDSNTLFKRNPEQSDAIYYEGDLDKQEG